MTLVCLSPNGVDTYQTAGPPDDVLVGTLGGVIRVSRARGSDGWRAEASGLDGLHVSSLLREPSRGAVFAGIHGGGLYRSTDDGRSWSETTDGLAHDHVFSLAYVDKRGRIELYAGTEPAHLYRSRDYGATWQELPALAAVPGRDTWDFPAPPFTAHVKNVAFDPRNPDVMYVCVEQGALLKSEDGGNSFRQLQFQDDTFTLNNDAHRIVFNRANPDEIYVDGGECISRSRDAGETWERLSSPAMRVAYPDHLYLSPDDPQTIFVAGGGAWPGVWRTTGSARSAIACSRDGGRSWTQLGGGLPEELAGNIEAATQVTWPGGFGFFAGTTDGEVFASFDKGATWSRIADNLPPVSKCIHYRNLIMGREAVAKAAQQTGA
jgi:photosystem II stability/assembly factor-like uncharacterized protein